MQQMFKQHIKHLIQKYLWWHMYYEKNIMRNTIIVTTDGLQYMI